ncbi:hypothetical protein [Priestia megaterium]|uniref:hypothetical protein n=1 Tax=Priestia megaterium TaxID=1404 RepID=UPI002D7E410F|nr:hypothetical protein [Priestia megaterium]MEB4860617.1 hypothetical protein [Priestia megaterium]
MMKIMYEGKEVFLSPIPELLIHGEEVYKAYLADCENGRIWSVRNKKFLKSKANKRFGYCYVSCRVKEAGRAYGVHQLVFSSYFGTTIKEFTDNGKLELNHIVNEDGKKVDNSISNLELRTRKEQYDPKVDPHVRSKIGSNKRLKQEQVIALKKEYVQYIGKLSTFCNEKAEELGFHPTAIFNLLTGKTYKNIII